MIKAIVLLSGGIDSSVALWWAKNKWEVYALTFEFSKSNRNEVNAARKLSKNAKVENHLIIDVNFLKQISELKQLRKNPLINKLHMPSTYIPSRNTVFFGVASYFSDILDARYIITGHISTDPFPDSKPKYVKAVNAALAYGSWLGKKYKTKIVMPFSKMDKISVLKSALKLKVPLELTWSCHKNIKIACGKCSGCNSRLDAFEAINLEDKISYNL